MIESPMDCYHLSATAVGELVTRPFGKLNPVLTQVNEAAPFTALDSFDQSLRRSSGLLLETNTAYDLLRHEGQALSQPAKGKAQFISDFPAGPIKQTLAGLSPFRRLLPLGSGQLRQAIVTFTDGEGKTHCRAYLMQLTTQNGRVAELVALQGIKGYDESLRSLREHVQELGGAVLNCNALYDQLFPTLSKYEPKPTIHIASDTSAFDAANKIVSTYIPVARANEQGIIADLDAEFLHSYRVQLRKIRSVLSLFEGIYDDTQTVSLKTRFSTLMAPTGPLRDLDVYLVGKQAYYGLLPTSLHNGLDILYSMFSRQRKAEKIKLSRYLRSENYKLEIIELADVFISPENLKRGPKADLLAHDYACELIWKRYRKVCRVASGIGPDTNDAEIHALRIHCKKLRYLMQFFSPVFPKMAFKKLLKPLKGLQGNLGLFNDYSVQQESLQTALLNLSGKKGDSEIEVAQSVGALVAVLHSRQLKERANVVKNFAKFNSLKTQQMFSELFQQRKDET